MDSNFRKSSFYIQVEEGTELFSGLHGLERKDMSAYVEKLTGALSNLSTAEYSDKLRDDAVRNGKAIIKNWQPPSDAQIDKILFSMREELLA